MSRKLSLWRHRFKSYVLTVASKVEKCPLHAIFESVIPEQEKKLQKYLQRRQRSIS